MTRTPRSSDSILKKIESLGTSLSLPTVRKALGLLEGAHASGRRPGSDDVLDIRPYADGDESRLIDWKTSARMGQPMLVQRERLATSRVWLMLDVGKEMLGSCEGGEPAYEVAANALRMFAMLSLRRSDDVSLVFGDCESITRVPFHGGFPDFERTLDAALDRRWSGPRNMEALLQYACGLGNRETMVVLASDEHAIQERHLTAVRSIARTHPLVLINVATINPFKRQEFKAVYEGSSKRRVPAFFIDANAEQEVSTHREYAAAALDRELVRDGATVIRADSSDGMFRQFVRLVSASMAGSARNRLRAATPIALRSPGDGSGR